MTYDSYVKHPSPQLSGYSSSSSAKLLHYSQVNAIIREPVLSCSEGIAENAHVQPDFGRDRGHAVPSQSHPPAHLLPGELGPRRGSRSASLPRFAIMTALTRRRAAHSRDTCSFSSAGAVKTLVQVRVRAVRPEADRLPRGSVK